jgi:hypothetical protein
MSNASTNGFVAESGSTAGNAFPSHCDEHTRIAMTVRPATRVPVKARDTQLRNRNRMVRDSYMSVKEPVTARAAKQFSGDKPPMEPHAFDRISRALARFGSRRALLRGVVGASAAIIGGGTISGFAESSTDGGLVFDYYQAIDARDYTRAYGFLGSRFTSRQSLQNFAAGFSDTAYDDLTINAIYPDTAGHRVLYDVTITAWHRDGAILRFTGTYVEGQEDGETKLVDAHITLATATGISPLCHASDLMAEMTGDAGAGQRYGTITVTNSADGPCVLGAVPRVTIRDESGHKLIAAKLEPNVPITTVLLDPDQKAELDLRWSNWCGGEVVGRPRIAFQLYGQGGTSKPLSGISVPPCLSDPGGVSTLTVKPWHRPA